METLGVFDECTNPRQAPSGTLFYCFIDADAKVGWQATRGVGVRVFSSPYEFEKAILEWCDGTDEEDYIPLDARVVSDMTSFISEGSHGKLIGTNTWDFSQWPPELWPEDVQRVLGGAVLLKQDICESR